MQSRVSRCYYHSDRDAVATCAICGAGICRECAVKDDQGRVLCYQCGNEYLRQEHKKYRKQLKESGGRFRKGTDFIITGIEGILVTIIFMVIAYIGGNADAFSGSSGVIMIYFLFTIPFCYTLLSDLFAPKYNLIFFRWILKSMISIVLGWIIFPFLLIRFIVMKTMSKKNKT